MVGKPDKLHGRTHARGRATRTVGTERSDARVPNWISVSAPSIGKRNSDRLHLVTWSVNDGTYKIKRFPRGAGIPWTMDEIDRLSDKISGINLDKLCLEKTSFTSYSGLGQPRLVSLTSLGAWHVVA